MAVTDWLEEELRRAKDPGWTFTETERKFLARTAADAKTIRKQAEEIEKLKAERAEK